MHEPIMQETIKIILDAGYVVVDDHKDGSYDIMTKKATKEYLDGLTKEYTPAQGKTIPARNIDLWFSRPK